jgi:hypothetical protein
MRIEAHLTGFRFKILTNMRIHHAAAIGQVVPDVPESVAVHLCEAAP